MRFTFNPASMGRVELADGSKSIEEVELEVGDAPEAVTDAEVFLRVSAVGGPSVALGLNRRELEALFELLRVSVRSAR